MYAKGDDSPDDELVGFCDLYTLVLGVVWDEPNALVLGVELVLLDGKFSIYACHHEVSIGGL
jgi:hypothetical protein